MIRASVLVLGAVLIVWAYPGFVSAWTAFKNTNSTKDIPFWVPPEMRAVLEQEINRVHREFYQQASLMGLGAVLLIWGLYLCLRLGRRSQELRTKR